MSSVPVRADALANRERLIAAAHDVFRERGLDAEMKVIAERAGVGVGTIYRNFPTKDDLITAITAQLVDELNGVCERADREEDPVQSLRVFLSGCLEVISHYGDVVLATKQRGLPDECINLLSELNPRGRIRQIVQKGIDSGVYKSDLDIEVAAALIESCLFPPTYKSLRETHTHEQITATVTDFHLRALMAR